MGCRVYHIAFVVSSLTRARRFYESLGLPISAVEEDSVDKFRFFVVAVDGIKLMMMEPTHPDGPVGRYLAKHGEGFHHLALKVPDCREAFINLRGRGIEFFGTEPREQSYEIAAFIKPRSSSGILVEIVEPKFSGGPTTGMAPGKECHLEDAAPRAARPS